MSELPDLNVTALAAGKGYQGKEQGRYGRSKRGQAVPSSFDMTKLLWYVTETTTDASASLKATVAEGVLFVSSWQSIAIDGTWGGVRVIKRVAVSEQEFPGLGNGEHLWLKISFVLSAGTSYRGQFQDISLVTNIPSSYNTESAAGPDDHYHAITLKSGGANELSTQLLTAYKEYSSHEYVVDSEELTDTDEICYVKIATFEVIAGSGGSNDRLVIKPHVVGCPITVPLVAVTYGDGVGD